METVIEGFGPIDLIEQVKNSEWAPSWPLGNNFEGIGFGGYCLVDIPDKLCQQAYEVIIEAPETEEKFVIEGYGSSNLLLAISMSGITFAGHRLSENPQKGMKFYQVTIK